MIFILIIVLTLTMALNFLVNVPSFPMDILISLIFLFSIVAGIVSIIIIMASFYNLIGYNPRENKNKMSWKKFKGWIKRPNLLWPIIDLAFAIVSVAFILPLVAQYTKGIELVLIEIVLVVWALRPFLISMVDYLDYHVARQHKNEK